ncbi:MAG: glycosyltransferase [Paracoccus sp. (in: a-proteobacteria)]
MSAGLVPEAGPFSDCAYVTLATNADYALGALALVNSIKATETRADCVVLHTAVPDDALDLLRRAGARLIRVGLLDTSVGFNAAHTRDALHARAAFTKGTKPPFHTPLDNFVKLRLWQLTEYRAVVFVDADAVMLKNCDRLFGYPGFCAAPNVYESLADFHRLNSGVFTARPSLKVFDTMVACLDKPGFFWRRTDQTFLETFFPDWHGLPVFYNMLQYVWFNMPELWAWDEIHILHYQYEKPWHDHDKADRLRPLIDLWRGYAGWGPRLDPAGLPGPLSL